MATIVSRRRHPALDIGEAERVDYLIAVAFMAAADHETRTEEMARLRAMCKTLEISQQATERVMEAVRSPDPAALEIILERLSASEMRYALLVDAISVAHADGRFAGAESDELLTLADKLDIPRAQAVLVHRYVDNWRKKGKAPSDARTTATLVGAGIPVAALAVASAAGAPLAAGVGLAAALGVSSYMSVKWLFRHRKGARAPGREPRARRRTWRGRKRVE